MTTDKEMVKRIMDCFVHNNISENDCETRVMTTKLKEIIEEVRLTTLNEVFKIGNFEAEKEELIKLVEEVWKKKLRVKEEQWRDNLNENTIPKVRQAVLAEVEKIFDSELTIGEIVDEIQSLKEGK